MSSYQPYGSYDPYSSYGSSYSSSSAYPSTLSGYSSPVSDYTSSSKSSKSSKKQAEHTSYFVPGYGISRQVILNRYQYLLGPSATIRPFSFQQREGYMITNAGAPLTKSQIEDLKRASQEYEEKEAMRMMSRSGVIDGDEVYINQPIPVQQRRHYVPETPSYGGR